MTGFRRNGVVLRNVAALTAISIASLGLLMGTGCPTPIPPPEPLVATAAANATSVPVGTTVLVTGNATGGVEPYTAFTWLQTGGPTVAIVPASGLGQQVSISASAAGSVQMQVTVQDSAGTRASASVSVTFTTVPPPVSTLAVTAAATPSTIDVPPAGTSVLAATPTGGTGVYTNFSWLQTGGPSVIVTDATSQNASASFAVAGTYTFTVTVVDSSAASKTSAPVTVTVTGTPPPVTLDFTLNCDNLAGSPGDDIFSAPAQFVPEVPGFVSTLQSCDQANGNGGDDVLNATLSDTVPPATLSPTLSGIQTVNLNAQIVGPAFNAVNTTGVTLFGSVGSIVPLAVSGIPAKVDAAMTNVITAGANLTLTYANASILGAAGDTMALTLSGVGAPVAPSPVFILVGPGVLETLDVASAGATKNKLNAIAVPVGLTNLNLGGAQAFEVEAAIVGAAATGIAVNASGNAGGVTLNAPAAVGVTFTGGPGNDTLRFAIADFTTADVVNGGAGANTLGLADIALNPPAAGLKSAINAATNFQTLELTGAGFAVDVDQVTPFTAFLISGGGANAVVNVSNVDTFTYDANAAAQTFTKKNALQNTLNVTLDGTKNPVPGTIVTVGALNSDETAVNLTSNGTNGNIVTVLGSAASATTNVLGTKDLQISGMTNAGTVAAGTFGAKLTVFGSAGNDAITGSPQADKIAGGAGVDVMAGGAGADIFRWNLVADAPVAVFGSTDIVNDFVSGTDKLSFDGAVAPAFGLVGGNVIAAANVATGGFTPTKNVVSITTAAATLSAVDAATAIGSASAAYAIGDKVIFIVHNATDTAVFVFLSAAADATVTAAELGGNPIISILGVTNVNATTDVTLTAVFP